VPFDYQADQHFARRLDAQDPMRRFRDAFHLPLKADGTPLIYFCGHSLGLQPKAVRGLVEQELDDWARLGVEGHFKGKNPWYSYHELFRESGARLVGARPGEVVMMNSLTVNLHLMLETFYRPTDKRHAILIDEPAFPSDLYAVQTHQALRSYGGPTGLSQMQPRAGENTIREEDIEAILDASADRIALVWLNGVNFATGQWFDIPRLTAAAHRHGVLMGFDLAHAAGNVPLALHDWEVDFAVWCNYKYVNCGPGAVAGCFVHEKHGRNIKLPRLGGWWGNDPRSRFEMHTEREFVPQQGAVGWQISNPPILAMAPLRASLALFDEAGMPALRAKSEILTGYLEYLLDRLPTGHFEIITPRDSQRRGCALSLAMRHEPQRALQRLEQHGVVCDFRPPNIIRVAPVPLYNTFEEVWAFAEALAGIIG
jgi:kynureninase